MKLLLDENPSPLTLEFLRDVLGHDVRRISAKALGRRMDDEEISDPAQRAVLARFFARYSQAEDIQNKLFVVTEGKTRVRRKP